MLFNEALDLADNFVLPVLNVEPQEVICDDLDILNRLKPSTESFREQEILFNRNHAASDLGQLGRNDPAPGSDLVDDIPRRNGTDA